MGLTVMEKVIVSTFNRIRFLEGAELDGAMKLSFGLTRLAGESDEEFLTRADEIIFQELDAKLDKEPDNGNL